VELAVMEVAVTRTSSERRMPQRIAVIVAITVKKRRVSDGGRGGER
jgi:hypothetical protein